MFWVVDSLMMRKYKLMKCLDDSCDSAADKGDADESQVRPDGRLFVPMSSWFAFLLGLESVFRKLKIKQSRKV